MDSPENPQNRSFTEVSKNSEHIICSTYGSVVKVKKRNYCRCRPTSLVTPLVLLLLLTFVSLLGNSAYWASSSGLEKVTTHRQSVAQAFSLTVSSVDSFLRSLKQSFQHVHSLVHGGLITELFDGLPETNMTLVETWANVALGLVTATNQPDLTYALASSASAYEQQSCTYWGNEAVLLGNITGDNFYHEYTPSSWEDIAAGRRDNYTLTETISFPMSVEANHIYEVYNLEYGVDPFYNIWVWACDVREVGKCRSFLTYEQMNLRGTRQWWLWIGIPLSSFQNMVESALDYIRSSGGMDANTKAWVVDVTRNALLAVSFVDDLNELVHPDYQTNPRLVSPQEFGDPIIARVSAKYQQLLAEDGFPVLPDGQISQLIDGKEYVGYIRQGKTDFLVMIYAPNSAFFRQFGIEVSLSVGVSLAVFAILAISWIVILVVTLRSLSNLVSQFRSSIQWLSLDNFQLKKSPFKEINALSDQFVFMRDRLVEWKRFLPRTIVEEVFRNSNVSEDSTRGGLSDASSGDSEKEERTSSNSTTLSTAQPNPFAPGRGFTTVCGTFCVIVFHPFDLIEKGHVFETVLVGIEEIANRFRGRLIDFSLEFRQVLVGFGLQKTHIGPSMNGQLAASFASGVVEACSRFGLKFTVALSHGVANVGTLGTYDHKTRILVGGVIAEAKVCCCVGKGEEENRIVALGGFFWKCLSDLEGICFRKSTAMVPVPTESLVVIYLPTFIFEGILDDGEWMYEKARDERLDFVKELNEFFVALSKNQVLQGMSLLDSMEETMMIGSSEEIREMVEKFKQECEKVVETCDGNLLLFLKEKFERMRSASPKFGYDHVTLFDSGKKELEIGSEELDEMTQRKDWI